MAPRNAQSFIVETMEVPGRPGAIQFVRNDVKNLVAGFNHACPCGCGAWSFIRLNAESWAPGTVPIWNRAPEGDDLHMTLSPSIGIHGPTRTHQPGSPYHWHGFLENGVFVER